METISQVIFPSEILYKHICLYIVSTLTFLSKHQTGFEDLLLVMVSCNHAEHELLVFLTHTLAPPPLPLSTPRGPRPPSEHLADYGSKVNRESWEQFRGHLG